MNYDTFLTAQQILTPARSEAISSTNSQVTALENTQMIEYIHALNLDFILAAHTRHHARGWSWLKKTTAFKTYTHSSLSAAISSGAATFTLASATNFDNSGRSVIETNRGALDFVDHSSKATNTLTVSTASGAETVSLDHATDKVHKLYATPSDYGRVHELWVNTREFRYRKFNGVFPPVGSFSTYGNFFFMPRGVSSSDVTVHYEQKHNNVSLLTSETNIPREFQRWAVLYTLHHLFFVRRKRADMPTVLQLAEIELEKALQFDATQSTSNSINLR